MYRFTLKFVCVERFHIQCEKKITPPPATCGFLTFFHKRLKILNQFFYTPIIYARLQIFIQLSQILTKLCLIKREYLVRILCSKCPPSAETHAFRRLRKSLIALLIVVCGKSSQIYCFYSQQVWTNTLDMTWRQQRRHLLNKQTRS